MPANLTPQYLKAEQEYRRATTPEEELRCLQQMYRELPKHKGTDKLQAELKQKISRVKKETEQAKSTAKRGGAARIPRQGAGRAVLIGPPNSGKSRLLASLTRATPEIAPYPFTTREPIPGMMPWEDVMVQLLDTPPITKDYFEPSLQGLVRGADLVLLVADLANDDGAEQLQEVLERFAATKTQLGRTTHLDEEDIGRSFTRTFLVLNKVDDPDAAARLELLRDYCELDFEQFPVSAEHGQGLEDLRRAVYEAMDVVRVYTKQPSHKDPDLDRPFTIQRGGTLLEVAELVHRDLAQNFKFARVWGEHVHPGTTVKGDYVVHDKDIVEIHA
jgi:uncharacterized protein